MAGMTPEYNNPDFSCLEACEARKAKEAEDLYKATHPAKPSDINSQRSDSIYDTALNQRELSNLHY
tara:strand:- start:551 stop:748 length:198 start_codon:yes stop_codon:yes gene_type:complete